MTSKIIADRLGMVGFQRLKHRADLLVLAGMRPHALATGFRQNSLAREPQPHATLEPPPPCAILGMGHTGDGRAQRGQ